MVFLMTRFVAIAEYLEKVWAKRIKSTFKALSLLFRYFIYSFTYALNHGELWRHLQNVNVII